MVGIDYAIIVVINVIMVKFLELNCLLMQLFNFMVKMDLDFYRISFTRFNAILIIIITIIIIGQEVELVLN